MPAASNENTLNAETAVSRMPLALAWQPAQRASSYGDKVVANFGRGGKVAPAMTTVLDDAYSAVVGEYQMTRRVSWRWQWH